MSEIEIIGARYCTTKELAKRLGMQRYQVMYRLDAGLIPDCKLKLGGRRFFSEEEVQNIEAIIRGGGTLEQAQAHDQFKLTADQK